MPLNHSRVFLWRLTRVEFRSSDSRKRLSSHGYSYMLGGRMRPPPGESVGLQAAGFADYVFYFWEVVFFLWRGERDCGV